MDERIGVLDVIALAQLWSRRFDGERGGVLLLVALCLPVLILFVMFVVEVGNWFEHRRHLQVQVDAAAFAGGDVFQTCFSGGNGSAVFNEATKYAGAVGSYQGTAYGTSLTDSGGNVVNEQVGGSNRGTVSVVYQSPTYPNGLDPSDGTETQMPCQTPHMMFDVKATEAGLPLFFGGLIPGFSVVPAINAHARVQLRQETTKAGSLPVAVPDPGFPVTAAAVDFVNEDTTCAAGSGDQCPAAILGSSTLANTTGVAGAWNSSASPAGVNMAGVSHLGVVVKLSGATPAPSTLTCGQVLVQCYDLSSVPSTGSAAPSRGLIFVQGIPTAGYSTATGEPVVKSVTLLTPGGASGCTNPYFFVKTSGTCQLGVQADVAFADATGNNRSVSATLSDYTTPTPDYTETNGLKNSSGSTWLSDGTGQGKYFNVPAQEGPIKVTLSWTKKQGTYQGNPCTSSSPCSGNWNGFVFQRTMSGGDPYSGSIASASVCEGTGGACGAAASYPNDGSASTTHNLWVNLQLQPSLGYAASVSSPPVYLRVEGSQNQTIDCDPGLSNLRQELDFGCAPQYTINKISGGAFSVDCSTWPASNNNWTAPTYGQPWPCVTVQTGGAAGQVTSGIEDRMNRLAGATCPTNNWATSFPNFAPTDPRLVGVILTPYGSFGGSGNANIPVTGFAEFYVTGWAKQGTGAKHPQADCTGDDPPPGADYIVGHFVKYVDTINNGGATDVCALSTFGNCVAVLSQ